MIFELRPQWYLVIVLLVSRSHVQGDVKETTQHRTDRTKRDSFPLFDNSLAGHTQDGVAYNQEIHNLWPYGDSSDSEVQTTGYRPGLFGTQYGYSFDSPAQQPGLDVESFLLDPLETRSNRRYFHNFLGKRDPETDINDRSQLDEIDNLDNDDNSDLLQRMTRPFSHNFIGKRNHQNNANNDLWKRIPAQLFSRRAPHYSHSFVGKRSAVDDDYNIKEIFNAVPTIAGFGEVGSALQRPAYAQSFDDNSNFLNFRSEPVFQFAETASGHKVVKRSSDNEKRVPYFGHSFVGKRSPGFGHSFVGKRAPRFGHSFVGKRGPRFGHSFVGKREKDSEETVEDSLVKNEDEDNLSSSLILDEFPEQTDFELDQDSPLEDVGSPEKRQHRSGQNNVNFLGKRPSFSHSFVGKRGPRFGHSFVGKRAPGFGHSFVGKRAPRFGHSFVGKRAPGFGHSFVGKRAAGFGHSFVGKRAPRFGHSFVGKRPGFSHSFVGKREGDSDYSFSDIQEGTAHIILADDENIQDIYDVIVPEEQMFAETKNGTDSTSSKELFDQSISVLNQNTSQEGIESQGKRQPSYSHVFVGKRAPRFGHSFVGKRAPRFGHSFVGKRAPRFGHSFVGKRAPRFGHSFVGKRAQGFGHSFVGKRAPRFGHSFVGKRAPRFGHSFVGKRAPRFGHSFVGKRAPRFGHSFVGKREDIDITEANLLDANLEPDDITDLVELVELKGSADGQEAENIDDINSSKTSSI